MFIPEKEQYREEALRFSPKIQGGLFELYDHILGTRKIKNAQKMVRTILSEIFTAQYSNETNIPLKFLDTSIGKVLFTIMFGMEERIYTVNDIIQMTVSESKEKGVSRAWLAKEIKEGSLVGTFSNGRWIFNESQVDDYLELRGYKNSK